MINGHEACAVLVWIAFIHSSRVFVRAKLRRVLRPDIVTAVDPNLPTSSPSDHFGMSKSGGAASSSHRRLCLMRASLPSPHQASKDFWISRQSYSLAAEPQSNLI